MDFIYIRVAVMVKGDKYKIAYSESDQVRFALAGYQLIGYETEWI